MMYDAASSPYIEIPSPISPISLPHHFPPLQLTMQAYSPPMGIPPEHVSKPCRRNSDSCEARPGLIESTHLAPLNEGLIAPDKMASPAMGIDPAHVRMTKGPRRNSCEARPGIIQTTHLAPLNEGLMAERGSGEVSLTADAIDDDCADGDDQMAKLY